MQACESGRAVCSFDRESGRLDCSPAGAALHGFAAGAEVTLEMLLECYGGPDRDALRAAVERAFAGSESRLRLGPVEGQCKDRCVLVLPQLHGHDAERVCLVFCPEESTDAGAAAQTPHAERRFRQTFEQAPIGMALVAPDGRFLAVNRALCEMLGHDEAALLETSFQAITHADDLQLDLGNVQRLLAGEGEGYRIEKRYLHRQGGIVHAQLDVSLLRDEEGRPLYFISQVQDISQRRRDAEALWESRELAQVTLSSIGDGVIRTDREGRIGFCNSAAAEMLGVAPESLVGRRFAEVVPLYSPDAAERLPDPVAEVLATGRGTRVPIFTRLRREDGGFAAIANSAMPLHDRGGALIGSVFVFHDVSVMQQMTEWLAHEALHDTLTGLPNRRAFEESLSRAVLDTRLGRRQHALLALDIDHFKSVNDTRGHAAGDRVLRDLARLLQSHLPEGDMLARMGGDEFAVILYDVNSDEAEARAQALVDTVRQRRFRYEEHAFSLRISAGMTMIDEHTPDPGTLMIQADTAAYVAKETGRDRVHRYEPGGHEIDEAARTMHWLQRLHTAFEAGRFELFLQRIHDVERRVCGYEALIRLRDDDGGLIVPGAFMPAARRLGLLAQIDAWVIENSLRMLRQARDEGLWVPGRYLTVNLSARSIGDVLFHNRLLALLDDSEVPAGGLVFEVTETEFLGSAPSVQRLLETLRRRGFKVWIDDFGSGYASFELLKRTRFDGVKTDGAFTQRLGSDPVDQALLKAICTIGRELQFPVVAEGVEDEGSFELLKSLGIQRFQGHLFHAAQNWREVLREGAAG